MPEYDHKCTECGHAFSVRRSLSEASREETCPVCGGVTRRVWTAPQVKSVGSCGPSSSPYS